ncbi:nuclear transport factor 2 family protein [Nocardioides sp. IC4_145]|uniref:nuclear transport factor 2 family protein n=1 Tax=Nocardioides sp. IC4_145 TaxID=2714037 RepID=UPI00140B06A1|nr:nuclear transport factor 2 family protein [Nocardioides sp. IC4_145]NHC21878.1 nuclear transport factor 2 family protein [Nocardioides sp. IC4_145]
MISGRGSQATTSAAIERQRVAEVVTAYALACDERDGEALERIFHPQATASYDVDADLVGGAAIARWVLDATAHLRWQQHALRVMLVDLDGDQARSVGYLTSHQVAFDSPDTTLMMNSRYDMELALVDDDWRIRSLRLVVGTREQRPVTLGQLVPDTRVEAAHV